MTNTPVTHLLSPTELLATAEETSAGSRDVIIEAWSKTDHLAVIAARAAPSATVACEIAVARRSCLRPVCADDAESLLDAVTDMLAIVTDAFDRLAPAALRAA